MVLSKARLGRLASAKLDASLGASEPHDFAVRFSIFRPARRSIAHRPCPPALHHVACPTLPRPPHPVPNVRDDRETPLCGTGRGESVEVIWVRRQTKYFCKRGWTDHFGKHEVICPSGKISGRVLLDRPTCTAFRRRRNN